MTKTQNALRTLDLLLGSFGKGLTVRSIMQRLGFSRKVANAIVEELACHLPNAVQEATIEGNRAILLRKSKRNAVAAWNTSRQDMEETVRSVRASLALGISLNSKQHRSLEDIFEFLDFCKTEHSDPPEFLLHMDKGHVDFTPYLESLETFCKAIRAGEVCSVKYSKSGFPNGKTDLFDFAPLRIVQSPSRACVIGRRVKLTKTGISDQGERDLLIQRVASVTPAGRSYGDKFKGALAPPQDVFGYMRTEPFWLEANFHPVLKRYFTEREWPGKAKINLISSGSKSEYKGWVKLRIYCGDPRETLSWLMGFGALATVVRPGTLKKLYRKEILDISMRLGGLRCTRKSDGPSSRHKSARSPAGPPPPAPPEEVSGP
ncbi:MAG: WYL domain-containing protein [Deltaproteobacteria bacterium]|jgi:hypothetical protein|nr:WYL domain-containing protein [Deltaproteobacteria bacterium]